MNVRGSGILLHISSLPSPFGIGDFGPAAHDFARRLGETGQRYWQILPLNPTDSFYDNTPYHSISAFALNPLFISPQGLVEDGLLDDDDISCPPPFPADRVAFDEAIPWKTALFDRAFMRFGTSEMMPDFRAFCKRHGDWLDDYALFVALKDRFGQQPWFSWPEPLKHREHDALEEARRDLAREIDRTRFLQFIAHRQWNRLRTTCESCGVNIIGDIPIYVDHDSADCWTNPGLFKLDDNAMPYVVAGVPPDYFSETGQLWGNPLYDWDAIRDRGYDWWLARVRRNLTLFDMVRIDHFRGLVAFWEVPAGEETAVNGYWVNAPIDGFLDALMRLRPCLPVIAEDLGLITPDVREVMSRYGLTGMKVLLFAFDGDTARHPYIPHNVPQNCVYYTGTHDNNTVRGYFDRDASPETRQRFHAYLGREVPDDSLAGEMMRLAMISPANTVIVPLQDVLGLGGDARMNTPGTATGNWRWRFVPNDHYHAGMDRVAAMTAMYGR